MPVCAKCKTQYAEGRTACPKCGASKDVATVATFDTVAEADMIRELLEENGIESVVLGETDPIGPASGAAPVELRVSAEDLEHARELYEAYYAGEPAEET